PTPPPVEVSLDVVLARVLEENGSVSELFLVCSDTEDIRRQHGRGLTLVAMQLPHCLRPVLPRRHVTLVLSDDKRNAVDEEHGVVSALLHALDAVLICRREVVEMLPAGGELNELHRCGCLTRGQFHACAVA